MHTTLEYEIFKKHPNNRPIDSANLKKITQSIVNSNLLHLRPIICDKEMNVIDGQHRLEAAKSLNIPIFYQIEEKIEDIDIILLNNNQKCWKLEDYFYFFKKKNCEEYIKFDEFLKEHDLDLYSGLTVMSSTHGDGTRAFKTGKFKMPKDITNTMEKLEKLKTVVSFINEKTLGNKSYLKQRTFIRALLEFIAKRGMNFNIFLKKLSINIGTMGPRARRGDYHSLLIDIYNYRNSYPI